MFQTLEQLIDYLSIHTAHVDFHHRVFTGDMGTKLKFFIIYIKLDQEDFALLMLACIDESLKAFIKKDEWTICIYIPE